MRLFISPWIAALASTALLLSAPFAAFACAEGEDATVTWNLSALGQQPVQGDATVSYTIISTPAPIACDPEDEDEGEPCDDTVPAPVEHTGTLEVPLNEAFESVLPAGSAEFVVEVPDFEPALLDRILCGDLTIRATLLPEAPSSLTVRVATWDDIASPENAKLTLVGLDERAGERYEARADADGTIIVEDIAPGFYELQIRHPLGTSNERIDLAFVDLLSDAQISVRLRSSSDRAVATVTCATALGGSSSAALLFSVLGLFLVSRRRHA